MKMITAIIGNEDARDVMNELSKSRFYFTKLATTGGFLGRGNTTLLLGVDDDKVDDAFSIIKSNSQSRPYTIPPGSMTAPINEFIPPEVTVGGATIFVVDVERFAKF